MQQHIALHLPFFRSSVHESLADSMLKGRPGDAFSPLYPFVRALQPFRALAQHPELSTTLLVSVALLLKLS